MATLGYEYDEILKVIRSKQNRIYFDVTMEIDIDGMLYPATKVTMLDVGEDFEMSFSADVVVEAQFNYAEYFRFIYPRRKDAKVIITRRLMSELKETEIAGVGDMVSVYRLIDIDNRDPDMQGMPSVDPGSSLFEVKFALLDLAIEQLKMVRVGGIFYDSTALDTLRYLLGTKSQQLDLPEDMLPVGVSVIPSDNKERRINNVVPQGTELLSTLPTLLQRDCGGIYNHDIGLYLKFKQWYIYPLYNTQRYGKEPWSVDIVVLPKNRSPGIERTYALRGKSILISTTGEIKQKDVTDIDYLNNGNGVMFGKATPMWDFAKTAGNKSTIKRSENLAEIMAVSRQSRLQNAPMSTELVTDNTAYQLSKLSRRRGYEVYLTWENSNPDILKPGMPVKLHIPVEGGSRESVGTLLGLESNTSPVSGELLTRRYNTNTIIRVFVSL